MAAAAPARSTSSEARWPQLDALRTLSLTAVVYQHTMLPRGVLLGDTGAMGLMVFFVISGFLITGILLDARDRAESAGAAKRGVLGRFYVRRFLRIFPLYYGVLAVAVLLHEESTRRYLAELVTYRTNFLLARLGHNVAPVTPLWSLAVEEHYYLVWPLIALFAPRRALWGAVAAMILGSVGARWWIASHGGSYQAITMPTYASVDGIALGCALALLARETDAAVRQRWLRLSLAAGAVLLAARVGLGMINQSALRYAVNVLPIGLIAVWLIDRATRNALPRWVGHRAIAGLGVMSYGMYVVHRYVMHYLGFDAVRGPQVFLSVFAVSAALAFASWHLFERPINDLKRFWPYVPRGAVAAPDDALRAARGAELASTWRGARVERQP
ncbi:MAG TPA: acyltransferase [Gemmatimonadaceae bacterium]|jgi:peptidoglycan/LPS O-acetylase OafA/YrhL|nr:acyltransferase [Gemmatimonadaceae bacterium]